MNLTHCPDGLLGRYCLALAIRSAESQQMRTQQAVTSLPRPPTLLSQNLQVGNETATEQLDTTTPQQLN